MIAHRRRNIAIALTKLKKADRYSFRETTAPHPVLPESHAPPSQRPTIATSLRAGQSRNTLGKKAASTIAIQDTASPALGWSAIDGTSAATVLPTVNTIANG